MVQGEGSAGDQQRAAWFATSRLPVWGTHPIGSPVAISVARPSLPVAIRMRESHRGFILKGSHVPDKDTSRPRPPSRRVPPAVTAASKGLVAGSALGVAATGDVATSCSTWPLQQPVAGLAAGTTPALPGGGSTNRSPAAETGCGVARGGQTQAELQSEAKTELPGELLHQPGERGVGLPSSSKNTKWATTGSKSRLSRSSWEIGC